MGVSVGVALAGWWLAYTFYLREPAWPQRLMTRYRGLYLTLLNKYWVDEIYDWLFVKPIKFCSTYLLWKFLDVFVVDGCVNGLAKVAQGSGGLLKNFQSGYVRSYGTWILLGGVLVVGYLVL